MSNNDPDRTGDTGEIPVAEIHHGDNEANGDDEMGELTLFHYPAPVNVPVWKDPA